MTVPILLPFPGVPAETPPPAPLAVDARAAAPMLSIALRTFRGHDAAGRVPRGIWIGGKKSGS